MAVTNFIPTIWEARLMAKFHERSVGQLITTAPTKIEGNKIIFNKVSDIALKDYEGSVSFDDLTTSKVLASNNLPVEFADFLIADTEEATTQRVDLFKNAFNEALEKALTERLRGNTPKTSTVKNRTFTANDIKNMSVEEINKNWEQIKNIKL